MGSGHCGLNGSQRCAAADAYAHECEDYDDGDDDKRVRVGGHPNSVGLGPKSSGIRINWELIQSRFFNQSIKKRSSYTHPKVKISKVE